MTVILLLICGSMLFYLIPGLTNATSGDTNPDSVAVVGGQPITVVEVQRQINQMERNGPVPAMMRSIYSRQIIDQLIFQQALYLEADRLGIRVTPQELTDRIKQFLPDAWAGGVWQKDRYATLVLSRTGMQVTEFENILRDGMLTEKFRHLVGDGIIVSPAEIEQEFRRRNEKVSIEYALVKPSDLLSTIHPSDADLAAYFTKNSYKYQIPEKRSARYALLDLAALRAHTQVTDAALQTYYNEHINDYKVENRVHVEQILFKTVGKTDAEIAEIKKKADDVDKQAKKGSNFEDLAKKNSEDDSSKAKGGDIGWIGQGQTVAEFEKVAFSLPKGGISDPVQTQYGIQIIKVLDHETARTKSFDEVRASILPIVLEDQVNTSANSLIDQIAASTRQSNRQSIDALAKKFNLELGDTPPATATEPLGDLGNSEDLHTNLFQLNAGELSQPIRVDRGFVVVSVKDIQRGHQASIAEVHDTVVADYQQQQSADLAASKATELAKAAQGGEDFAKAAKQLGFDVKTSAPFAVTGSVPDVGTGQQLAPAFGMSIGQVSAPKQMGTNWLVYRVATHEAANPEELEKQKADIEQQILQTKQNDAFGAFKSALEERLAKEGKLVINKEVEDRLTKAS